jgi:predicted SnoaL-like aldol condensation-catalyzing enzyme
MERHSHKVAAMDFLRLAASGSVPEAYHKHVAAGFRHHNPYFRGDAESLAAGMEENASEFPGKKLEILRAVEEGELVAVHSRVRMKPGDPGTAVVHIFRFKANLIAELWDIGQPVPENSPNEHGMF